MRLHSSLPKLMSSLKARAPVIKRHESWKRVCGRRAPFNRANCAVVDVDEPIARSALPSDKTPRFSLLAPFAKAIGSPLLDLCGDDYLVVDDAWSARVAELKHRPLIVCGGLLGAVTQISMNALIDRNDVFIGVNQYRRHCSRNVIDVAHAGTPARSP